MHVVWPTLVSIVAHFARVFNALRPGFVGTLVVFPKARLQKSAKATAVVSKSVLVVVRCILV